jgi:hypothetical protein
MNAMSQINDESPDTDSPPVLDDRSRAAGND